MFIATAAAICSLGHGLRTFTTVPGSTQPCNPPGSVNQVTASAEVRAGMPGAWQCDPIIRHVSSRGGDFEAGLN